MSLVPNTLSQPIISSFNSAYRLTLRALSAGVRHHQSATRNLRTLFRPTFREAAIVLHRYLDNPSEKDLYWLREWNARLDRTLSLLHSSATSAGRPAHLVRNLAYLTDVYRTRAWMDATMKQRIIGKWDSQNTSRQESKVFVKKSSMLAKERVQLSAWSALAELVTATENDLRILAGRQEQRQLPFSCISLPRYTPGSPKKRWKQYFQFVGRITPRPRDLKA